MNESMFEQELSHISDLNLRNVASKLLEIFEPKMIGLSSSRGGIHHPPDEDSETGFILHCKRVAYMCCEIVREHDLKDFWKNVMIFSAIFHDIGRIIPYLLKDKNGKEYGEFKMHKSGHGPKSVELIMKELKRINTSRLRTYLSSIYQCIASHMSHWDKDAPRPATVTEVLFATADYFASRRWIKTPTLELKEIVEL